ncbi:MAG: GNAT family N-acetyltransferase [Actinomycetota bacterium]|nr:GNAT family N-acetyltransferase [Actinomycetota bacterium]
MEQQDDVVETERTRLVLMSPAFMEAMLAGNRARASDLLGAEIPDEWPDEGDRWLLRIRAEQLRTDPSSSPWLVRAIVERTEPRMLGHVGFHGPPDENGIVEIGYTVLAPYRRRGLAREAARAMLAWAHREHGIKHFRASASPENEPSLRLIESFGFFQVGVQWDERDGKELVFEANYES